MYFVAVVRASCPIFAFGFGESERISSISSISSMSSPENCLSPRNCLRFHSIFTLFFLHWSGHDSLLLSSLVQNTEGSYVSKNDECCVKNEELCM